MTMTETMIATDGTSGSRSSSSLVKMAYLGPQGTYGEQAARAFSSRYSSEQDVQIELLPCPTISDIYNHPAELHVMPLENTIQGGVIETLDCLLSTIDSPSSSYSSSSSSSGINREVLMDLALPIRHCLVVKKGTKMEDIKWVRSHEQALGQSSSFLAKYLPKAKLEGWSSTAGAALSLLSTSTSTSTPISDINTNENGIQSGSVQEQNGAGAEAGAAICSRGVVRLYPELEILYQGTQAIEHNYTRFLLLGPATLLPSAIKQQQSQTVHPLPKPSSQFFATHFYALPSLDSLPKLAKGRSIRAIHTRPAPSSSSSTSTSTSTSTLFPARYLVQLNFPIIAGQDLLDLNESSDSDVHEESVKYLGAVRDTITEEELASL